MNERQREEDGQVGEKRVKKRGKDTEKRKKRGSKSHLMKWVRWWDDSNQAKLDRAKGGRERKKGKERIGKKPLVNKRSTTEDQIGRWGGEVSHLGRVTTTAMISKKQRFRIFRSLSYWWITGHPRGTSKRFSCGCFWETASSLPVVFVGYYLSQWALKPFLSNNTPFKFVTKSGCCW